MLTDNYIYNIIWNCNFAFNSLHIKLILILQLPLCRDSEAIKMKTRCSFRIYYNIDPCDFVSDFVWTYILWNFKTAQTKIVDTHPACCTPTDKIYTERKINLSWKKNCLYTIKNILLYLKYIPSMYFMLL